jgi:hypothetical protein
VVLPDVLARRDEKAARAAGRITNHVVGLWLRHLDHEADDVAGRAELAVLTRRGDLAEHVLVEVALGVAVLHRNLIHHVYNFCEKRGSWDREPGILHVACISAVAAKRSQEREDVLADHLVHLSGRHMLEAAPTQVCVGPSLAVLSFGIEASFDGRTEAVGFVLLQLLEFIEPSKEEQVCDLLDDLDRVRDSPRKEGHPDAIDLVAQVAGEHKDLKDFDRNDSSGRVHSTVAGQS